jgi:hypothetical protein
VSTDAVSVVELVKEGSSHGAECLSVTERVRWAAPFVLIGTSAIVTGGLVAAVTRPTHFDLGPWVAAFLVLVVGVAQISLGAGQACLADARPSILALSCEAVSWNLGAVATLVGTLWDAPAVTTIGAVSTAASLGWFLAAVWPSTRGPRWARSVYVGGVALLFGSALVGVVLAWTGSQ